MSLPLPRMGITSPDSGPFVPHVPNAASPVAATCANCLAPLGGAFCSRCGAPSLDHRPVTVARFAGELWNEVSSVDSSTVRTLRALLTRPGELTRAFLEGRTRWYLPPLRVFLLTFAFYLFVRSFTPMMSQATTQLDRQTASTVARSGQLTALTQELKVAEARTGRAAPDVRATQVAAFQAAMTNQWLRLADPLIIGAMLAALFLGRRRNYAEHVLFAVHLMAFNWVLSSVTALLRAITGAGLANTIDPILLLHWAAFGTYAYLAARRVHEEPRLRTGVKAVAITAGAQLTMVLVPMLVTFAYSVSLGWQSAHFLRR